MLRYKRKALTLKQWSARGGSGLSPSEIWHRLKLGFEVVEALGGRDCVVRAIAFVSERERRARRRQAKLLKKQRHIKAVKRKPQKYNYRVLEYIGN